MGNETVLLVCAQFHGGGCVCVCVPTCVRGVLSMQHSAFACVCLFVYSDSVYKNKPNGVKCHFSCSGVWVRTWVCESVSKNHEGLREGEPVRRLCCILKLPEGMKEEVIGQHRKPLLQCCRLTEKHIFKASLTVFYYHWAKRKWAYFTIFCLCCKIQAIPVTSQKLPAWCHKRQSYLC